MNYFEPSILLCLLLFKLVLCKLRLPEYFHAKENITLTCDNNNNAHIWYIKEHDQQKDSLINENNTDYFIRTYPPSITIYKPINNAVFKTKIDSTDDFFDCEVTVKLFVYPEEYNAYFTFNDISKNVSFQHFRRIPSHYEIPLFTDNPEHFTLNYSYKVEGLPLDYLKINGDPDENRDRNCFTRISNYKCLERNEIIDTLNGIPKILQLNFSYFFEDLEEISSQNVSIGHISIDLNIEYRPKLESSTIIIDKPEKYILNCTEKYSNPPVKTYKWNSTRKEFQTWNITSPIYEFEYNETLDDITFTCNASNEKYYSLAYFRFIKPKKIQDNSLKNWEITLIVIIVSLGCIIVVSIIVYMKKKSSCKKGNITPSPTPNPPATPPTNPKTKPTTEDIQLDNLEPETKFLQDCFEKIIEKIDTECIYTTNEKKANGKKPSLICCKPKTSAKPVKYDSTILNNTKVSEIANIVISYLKSFKKPLIKAKVFQTISQRHKQGLTGNLKDCLKSEPIIEIILEHLKEVALNSRKNKMTPAILAKTFAFCLEFKNTPGNTPAGSNASLATKNCQDTAKQTTSTQNNGNVTSSNKSISKEASLNNVSNGERKNDGKSQSELVLEYMINEFMNYDVPILIRDCVEVIEEDVTKQDLYFVDNQTVNEIEDTIISYEKGNRAKNEIKGGKFASSLLARYLDKQENKFILQERESILNLMKEQLNVKDREVKFKAIMFSIEKKALIFYLLDHFYWITSNKNKYNINIETLVARIGYKLLTESTNSNVDEKAGAAIRYILENYEEIIKLPIPAISEECLRACFKIVEKNVKVEGIYRISVKVGTIAGKIKMKDQIDTHTAACYAKQFIKKNLKLFEKTTYENIVKRINQGEIGTIRDDVLKNHGALIMDILEHLKKVVDNCEANKMNAFNLAIIFAPNFFGHIIKDEVKSDEDRLKVCKTEILIVEYMITEFIYEDEIKFLKDSIEFIDKQPNFRFSKILEHYSSAKDNRWPDPILNSYKKKWIEGYRIEVHFQTDSSAVVILMLHAFQKILNGKPVFEKLDLLALKEKVDQNDRNTVLKKFFDSEFQMKHIVTCLFKNLKKIAEKASRDKTKAYSILALCVRDIFFEPNNEYDNILHKTFEYFLQTQTRPDGSD